MDAAKLLENNAKSLPDKPAFIFKDKQITFPELRDKVFKLAEGLKLLGVGKSDKVALYLPNSLEYVYSYLAVWCCGAVAVPLDFMLTEEELISCESHCEAKVLIIRQKPAVSLANVKAGCQNLKDIITAHEKAEGYLCLEELLSVARDKFKPVAVEDKDYAIIFYTSGTTGRPKGVLVNYSQLDAPPKAMDFFVDLSEKDIVLCALPFSHLGGLIYIQNCVSFGLTAVLMERFSPMEFLKNISYYRISCFWIVPSMYYAFLQLKEFEAFDLSSLRWIVTFGASNSPEALRRFQKHCPQAHLLNGWGLTETNAPTTVIPLGSKNIESVGRPAPWVEVKIFSTENEAVTIESGSEKELPLGEVGEIAVKGWVVTDGYYKNPEATRQAIRNGWFYTGDLGKFDSDGSLYIVGRKKEMLKVGGEIVFEPEIEAAIHKHPCVSEAAVVAVDDRLRGEVPKAFVVLKEKNAVSEEELRYFCRQHLAHFKIPHYFEFKDSLPKNRTGKIDKEKLKS
jgi:acyl-CoA synthetase (AMP-forming)/AMP-acid ligase II